MIRNNLTDYLSQHFQIVVLEKWSDLDVQNIKNIHKIENQSNYLSMNTLRDIIYKQIE